jgi:hypothetical protein
MSSSNVQSPNRGAVDAPGEENEGNSPTAVISFGKTVQNDLVNKLIQRQDDVIKRQDDHYNNVIKIACTGVAVLVLVSGIKVFVDIVCNETVKSGLSIFIGKNSPWVIFVSGLGLLLWLMQLLMVTCFTTSSTSLLATDRPEIVENISSIACMVYVRVCERRFLTTATQIQ